MKSSSGENSVDMKFGVIVVSECADFLANNLEAVVEALRMQGCLEENIVLKYVPTLHDSVVATQFMAQYTDGDGVIIVAPKAQLMETLSLMNGIIQIQVQWSMVVEIGGAECAKNIVSMISLQNEMELASGVNRAERSDLC
jgi:6,7-dimethyl-8-ribityllumazine synthase